MPEATIIPNSHQGLANDTAVEAGALVENAGLDDGLGVFAPDDSVPLPTRQRTETCAHCRQLRPVRGWVFASVCAPCHANECARIERNRARRRRRG